MTPHDVRAAFGLARELADKGDAVGAWRMARPLMAHAATDAHAALALAMLLGRPIAPTGERVDHAARLLDRWSDDLDVLVALGHSSETLTDLRRPIAPPHHPMFEALVLRLRDELDDGGPADLRLPLAEALSTAARAAGPRFDGDAEEAFAERFELSGDRWQVWYDRGLFLKVRGRFAEGLHACRRAVELGCSERAVWWNHAICATGCGDGAAALEAWAALSVAARLGPDGLPVGDHGSCGVLLCEHPPGSRADAPTDGDPGREVVALIRRVSACHGALIEPAAELGLAAGALVLHDGAALAQLVTEAGALPVFPHLATLGD